MVEFLRCEQRKAGGNSSGESTTWRDARPSSSASRDVGEWVDTAILKGLDLALPILSE